MEKINYFKVLRLRKGKILFITLAVFVLSIGLSLIQPLKYSCSTRFLVIQKSAADLDVYSAIRSAERISGNLGQVIHTTSFFQKVLATPYNIDKNIFSNDEIKKRKQWNKMIKTRVYRETGMLEVIVYHQNPEEAVQFSKAVAYVLTTQSSEYFGSSDIEIKVVDNPLLSRYPVKPNILINAFMGLVIGFLLAVIYILVSYESSKAKMAAYEASIKRAEAYNTDEDS